MLVNVIKLQTKQMLLLALLIKEHEEKKGNDSVLLVPDFMREELESVALIFRKDYVVESDFVNYVSSSVYTKLNYVIHHYDTGLDAYSSALSCIEGVVKELYISYYADGYVNVFLNMEKAIAKLKDCAHIKPLRAYSFDAAYPYFEENLKYATHEIVSSRLLEDVYKRYDFEKHLKSKLLAFKESHNDDLPYLFLVMRPWGSETFHGGNYSLLDGAKSLYEIVSDMIMKIREDAGEDFTIMYRADKRDSELMIDFQEKVSVNGLGGMKIIDLDTLIPTFLTMDSVFYYFDKYVSRNFYTTIFDSTTSLSLLPLGIGVRHYFGASLELTKQLQKASNMADVFLNKVNISRQHIKRLGTEIKYSESQVESGLYVFTKIMAEGEGR